MTAVSQILEFTDTVPAGTAASSPRVLQCQLGMVQVDWIEVEVPPGPRGQLGIFIATSLQQIIPFRVGATPIWMFLDGVEKHWDVVDMPDSGDFQAVAFNAGSYPHTYWVRFGVNNLPGPTFAPPAIIPASALAGTVPGS